MSLQPFFISKEKSLLEEDHKGFAAINHKNSKNFPAISGIDFQEVDMGYLEPDQYIFPFLYKNIDLH